jgi:hypothetical protein
MTMHRTSAFMLGASMIPLIVAVVGCGGMESTASRSAAAYDEAQRKGVAIGHPAHGGHTAEPAPQKGTVSPDMPATEHSRMPGRGVPSQTQTDTHAEMDHSKTPNRKPSGKGTAERAPMAGMDHSRMAGMAGHQQTQTDPHAGMHHSKMPGMSHDMPISAPSPEPVSATAKPGQPAETLQPGSLDQPPATSVADAARSAAMAAEMAGGGHGMSHGKYQHLDVGRDTEAPSLPASPQVKEHKH